MRERIIRIGIEFAARTDDTGRRWVRIAPFVRHAGFTDTVRLLAASTLVVVLFALSIAALHATDVPAIQPAVEVIP